MKYNNNCRGLILLSLLLVLTGVVNSINQSNQTLQDYPINPFIGSGGFGFGAGANPIGAQTPYGMARVGPDTSNWFKIYLPFDSFGGYYYADSHINTFSHLHMVGPGVVDYGWLGIMPISVSHKHDVVKTVGKYAQKKYGFRSRFNHHKEHAEPGYYSVNLLSYDIEAEVTASDHVGLHRFTWNDKKDNQIIIFDSSYTLDPKACNNSYVNIDPINRVVTGWVFAKGSLSGRYGGSTVYFYAKLDDSIEIQNYGVWNQSDGAFERQTTTNGCNSGAFLHIHSNSQQATVKFGISFVSFEQAKTNIEVETGNLDFNGVRQQCQQLWLNQISKFDIQTENKKDAEKFFSSIYHSLLSPTKWSEANGVYLGFDFQVHTKPDYINQVYTDLSIWDVHRTQFPWILFHDPVTMQDIVNSIMLIYEQGNYLPKWPFANGWTGCMIGSHVDVVISDLITKQEFNHLNLTMVMEALNKLANTEQPHDSRWNPSLYKQYQYVPYDMDSKSACETMSYSYDDWAIGNVAKFLKLEDQAQDYYGRSQWYKNIFSKDRKFPCSKNSTGFLICPSKLEQINPFDNHYTEGDAWQYRYFVLQDPEGLIELLGGKDIFVEQLNKFAFRSRFFPTNILPNPYYWPGNEPDLFSLYMFSYADRPDLTQKYVRWVVDEIYSTEPNGLPGNDDYGTMSAWFIFSSIGFYPRAGCTQYIANTPLFDKIVIKRGRIDSNVACTLEITTHNSKNNRHQYIDYIELDGQRFNSYPFFDHLQDFKCKDGKDTVKLDYYLKSKH